MKADIEKYLDKHRVTDSNRDLYKGEYTNKVATGLASLDGSMQFFGRDVYVNGKVIVSFIGDPS